MSPVCRSTDGPVVSTRSSGRNGFSRAQRSQSHRTQRWMRPTCWHRLVPPCAPFVCALGTMSVCTVVQLSCRAMLSDSNSSHAPRLAQPGCLSERETEAPGWRSTWKSPAGIVWVPPKKGGVQFSGGTHNSALTSGTVGRGYGFPGKTRHAEHRVGLISTRLFLIKV